MNITGKKRGKMSFNGILDGGILTEDCVIKQSKLLVLIAFLFVIFISNSYDCAKKLTRIEYLKTKLEDVKYENLVISVTLTSYNRQSQVEELLKTKGMELSEQATPLFEICK